VCTSDVWAFRVAPAHEEPRSGSNNSEHDSTIDRSTNYGSGHLNRIPFLISLKKYTTCHAVVAPTGSRLLVNILEN
jgi:hypothetical protein